MLSHRVRVIIPKQLRDEIDSVIGRRRRSSFICAAVREKLVSQKQVEATRKFAGSLAAEHYLEWTNGSAVLVHNLRREDEKMRERKLRQRSRKRPI